MLKRSLRPLPLDVDLVAHDAPHSQSVHAYLLNKNKKQLTKIKNNTIATPINKHHNVNNYNYNNDVCQARTIKETCSEHLARVLC